MAFLRRLLSFFGSFTPTRPKESIPETVRDEEPIVRYIIDSKHFQRSKNSVKPDAFLPHGDPPETSVFRIDRLDETEIWEIGNSIAKKRERTLKARADFEARSIAGTPLRFHADDDPPRHANIVGWPIEKAHRLQLSLEIAQKATLRIATEG